MKVQSTSTPDGVAYALLPPHPGGPAPTLLLLASTGIDSLTVAPYCRTGRLLHDKGWNVVSLDLPCHGADGRPGEPASIAGWAHRIARGEDIAAAFQQRVNAVLEHLTATDVADPARLAAAGTSRGGFLAFHAAAGHPGIRAVAGFAPVTDLLALYEFAELKTNPLAQRLALAASAEALADRAASIMIGNADDRVDTDKAVSFAKTLVRTALARDLQPNVALHLLPIPGHRSFADWHDQAAAWLMEQIGSSP